MGILNFKCLKKDFKGIDTEIAERLIQENDVSVWPASTLIGKLTVFAALIQSAKQNVDLVLTNETLLSGSVGSALGVQALRGKSVRVLCATNELAQHCQMQVLRGYVAEVRVASKLPAETVSQLIENGSYLLVDDCRMAAEVPSHKDNGIFWIPSVTPQKNTVISADPLINIPANQKRFNQRKALFESLWLHGRV